MIKNLLFDLDGTLLAMDQDEFVAHYFKELTQYMEPFGYDPKELEQAIWKGTGAMIMDQSDTPNEKVFWHVVSKLLGDRVFEDMPHFEEFYRTEFQKIANYCPSKPSALQFVDQVKTQMPIALATNPIFPAIATYSRMKWAGLNPEDFRLITTYENSTKAKPSPAYFEEVLDTLSWDPEETLMIGNDATEDVAALKAGMPVFLVTDHLINKENKDLTVIPHGSFEDLMKYLETIR